MKYAVVIEIEADNEGVYTGDLEKAISRILRPWVEDQWAKILNVEAAKGSLAEAFGVGAEAAAKCLEISMPTTPCLTVPKGEAVPRDPLAILGAIEVRAELIVKRPAVTDRDTANYNDAVAILELAAEMKSALNLRMFAGRSR